MTRIVKTKFLRKSIPQDRSRMIEGSIGNVKTRRIVRALIRKRVMTDEEPVVEVV